MPANETEAGSRPFVETTIARHLLNRLRMTHADRAISVFSGPWGIGKTTAIDAFAAAHEYQCAIVKVEPGARGKGAAPARVMQYVAEALQALGSSRRGLLGTGYLQLRQAIWDYFAGIYGDDLTAPHLFTFIFDEAQNLSREAIETLRYWNDQDRCTTPFPVGLVFVGNNEFEIRETYSGLDVISGAVRSRALFVEELDYADVTDADLVLFSQSRGIVDAAAIAGIVQHYSTPRVKRDLRNVERLIEALIRRAGDGPVTRATLHEFFNPA